MVSLSVLLSICVVLLADVIFVYGEEVKFSKCQKFQRDKDGVARQYEQSCNIQKVFVDPCPDAASNEPCKVKHGNEGAITVHFTPQFSATNISSQAYWDQALMNVPFEDMDTNGCKYMKCPMEKDVATTYSYKIGIKSTYPPDIYTVKWKVLSAEDPTKECCFRFRLKIVP
ncbi:MD-2-related lipid-recognition protein-like [Nilaparvata lugens]|uniref:MD-2-related lipid-recognition protein-like n=1 Tax=Nilaparvata lugens TaxID=108931 RepID=UPI00193DEFAA|nr:MD-2-related lipid-recognition protein-like [Nilaparvata lugens]